MPQHRLRVFDPVPFSDGGCPAVSQLVRTPTMLSALFRQISDRSKAGLFPLCLRHFYHPRNVSRHVSKLLQHFKSKFASAFSGSAIGILIVPILRFPALRFSGCLRECHRRPTSKPLLFEFFRFCFQRCETIGFGVAIQVPSENFLSIWTNKETSLPAMVLSLVLKRAIGPDSVRTAGDFAGTQRADFTESNASEQLQLDHVPPGSWKVMEV